MGVVILLTVLLVIAAAFGIVLWRSLQSAHGGSTTLDEVEMQAITRQHPVDDQPQVDQELAILRHQSRDAPRALIEAGALQRSLDRIAKGHH